VLAFVVHTFGLIFRMVLEGRPPVTNLYSSAIFIGWGACVLGLVLERIYKVGLGSAVAGLAGFITLLIAHNLALGGDTMEMLRAVLDTNFWLATHVITVTLGYAATFFAGTLALAYVVLGVCTPLLSKTLGQREVKVVRATGAAVGAMVGGVVGAAVGGTIATAVTSKPGELELGKALAKMVYAIVCFATLFSFIGTVLGGIWADQSWGRFWGWDPKENGALLIVIWNALILHARWGGMVKERGLMNLAIFGNIVTAFSWFGVNMLGIGLHSYGFMDSAFKWLMLFNTSQLVVVGLGLFPLQVWESFAQRKSQQASETVSRPVSVTIVSVFLIVMAVINPFMMAVAADSQELDAILAKNAMPLEIQKLFGWLGLVSMLLCGVGSFKGVNWSRWLYVCWGGIGVVVSLLNIGFTLMMVPSLIIYVVVASILFSSKSTAFFAEHSASRSS